MTMYTIWWQ